MYGITIALKFGSNGEGAALQIGFTFIERHSAMIYVYKVVQVRNEH